MVLVVSRPDRVVDFNPEKQPLVEQSPAKLSIAESGHLKPAVGDTSLVSTMENCSQQDVEISMRDDACMERFQVRFLYVYFTIMSDQSQADHRI